MKDAQAIMCHKHIKTPAEIYMDQIPDSVRKAIDARLSDCFQETTPVSLFTAHP